MRFFFVTDAMLDSSRGWCVFELAFAEILQSTFQVVGGCLTNLVLPLFLVPKNDPRLPRSVWQLLQDRGTFADADTTADQIDWCVERILTFLRAEQKLTRDMLMQSKISTASKRTLRRVPGLIDRVTRFHPAKIPPRE